MVAAGLMEEDSDGFMQIAPSHDHVDSALRMVEFAKGALTHSRTVLLPGSNKPVTVCEILMQHYNVIIILMPGPRTDKL